jgi:hypothetical protein
LRFLFGHWIHFHGEFDQPFFSIGWTADDRCTGSFIIPMIGDVALKKNSRAATAAIVIK